MPLLSYSTPESASAASISRPRLGVVLWWWFFFAYAAGQYGAFVYTLRILQQPQWEGMMPIFGVFYVSLGIPFLALLPLCGVLFQGRWRMPMLFGYSFASLAAVGHGAYHGGPWPSLLAILWVAGIGPSLARQTLLPVYARAARIPYVGLQVIWGLAIPAGCLFAFWFGVDYDPKMKYPPGHVPEPLQVAFAGPAAAFVLLLFLPLPREKTLYPRAGVFRPLRQSLAFVRQRFARRSFVSLVLLGPLAVILHWHQLFQDEVQFWLSACAGGLIALNTLHTFRGLRIMIPASLLLLLSLVQMRSGAQWQGYPILATALTSAMLTAASVNLNGNLQPVQRPFVWSLIYAFWGVLAFAFGLFLWRQSGAPEVVFGRGLGIAIVLAGILSVHAAIAHIRPLVEGLTDMVFSFAYRYKLVGEMEKLPLQGPALVICNHASWMDPMWLAKILPMPTTPMMTASFYDLPVIHFLMKRVIGTIRVAEVARRKEAPELKEAIAALHRDDTIVLFPEGWLRRKEEVPIRRFGRGVWEILSKHPHVPIYAFWIEGSWGSYFSWRNGKPMQNKKPDMFYPLQIAMVEVSRLEPEILADHWKTRDFLLQEVLRARGLLGLGSIGPIAESPEGNAETTEKESSRV